MTDISYDETVAALAGEGLVDGAAAPEAGDGGLLGGALGSAGTVLAAGFIGSKLGGKSAPDPVSEVVATVTDTVSKPDQKKAPAKQAASGALDKLAAVPGVASSKVQGAVQSILEEFLGGAGSSGIGGEFTKAMQEISAEGKKSRPLPSISNVLPSVAKSVTGFVPGMGE